MPNIDMSYFVDSEGNHGYFKDQTARDQIAVINQNRVAVFEKTYTGNISNAWGGNVLLVKHRN